VSFKQQWPAWLKIDVLSLVISTLRAAVNRKIAEPWAVIRIVATLKLGLSITDLFTAIGWLQTSHLLIVHVNNHHAVGQGGER
tara:strand:- start:317 stop:565 length:249 start_codon:yes stop_codon:yes gene_type:complete